MVVVGVKFGVIVYMKMERITTEEVKNGYFKKKGMTTIRRLRQVWVDV